MLTEQRQPPSPPPVLRDTVTITDRHAVRRIVDSTHFFRDDETAVAVELVDEYLAKGERSGYRFVFAEIDGTVVGYACFGPIACTIGSFDLYWIAVDPKHQGCGLGRILMAETERRIRDCGGRQIYIETSGRPDYLPTRVFYERCGYTVACVLPDFYEQGDDKVVWNKVCRAS
ncbi:MAG: GNAT family N-acetyltransferase [Planctomycetaceae bacterium]